MPVQVGMVQTVVKVSIPVGPIYAICKFGRRIVRFCFNSSRSDLCGRDRAAGRSAQSFNSSRSDLCNCAHLRPKIQSHVSIPVGPIYAPALSCRPLQRTGFNSSRSDLCYGLQNG